MLNVSSQPRLILQKIPKGWCPSGSTLAQKFQAYQDQFLANATFSIPGLEDINLQDLANFQAQLTDLQSLVAALNKQVRHGRTSLVTNGEVDLLITPNMPSADYSLSLTIVSPDGSSPVVDHFEVTYVDGSKEVTGCKLICHNVPSGYFVDWTTTQN